MDIRYLGPLEVLDAGRPQPLGGTKQRLVLAHLLIETDNTLPAERLIDRVWVDRPPAAARASLHSYVSNLRRIVGTDRILSRGQGYAFVADGARIDRREFEELAARGRRLLPTDPAEASRLLQAALGLWRGQAFADLADERSLAGETARLTDLRLAVLDDRVSADLACGRARELLGELRALTHSYPLHERFWAHLMVALYRSGRQAGALAVFTEARHLLAEELGVDPSPELVRLQQQILRHDDLDGGAPALRGYRLLERIGSGRSAIVWRATQPGVERVVALKAVRRQLANSPAFIRRFHADAQAVARVEHPHAVPLYDFWREPDGAFLAMRHLSGGNVASLLERDQPPAPAVALRVVDQAAAAVAAAHRQGVVHGNLKPSNILLDGDGAAYVSDFLIARDGHATTAPHVAPERRGGAGATAATDVYALGDLLRQLEPSTDGSLADVVARATSVDPTARYAEADAFLTALRTAAPAAAGRDDTPVMVRARGGRVRNPYKGLRAFGEGDAADFFGRDTFVERLVERLSDHAAGRFVAVVGPSGSGKSFGRARRADPRAVREEAARIVGLVRRADAAGRRPVRRARDGAASARGRCAGGSGGAARGRGWAGCGAGGDPARRPSARPADRSVRGAVHPGRRSRPARPVPAAGRRGRQGSTRARARRDHAARRLLRPPAARARGRRPGPLRHRGRGAADRSGARARGHGARRTRRCNRRQGSGRPGRHRRSDRAGRAATAAVRADGGLRAADRRTSDPRGLPPRRRHRGCAGASRRRRAGAPVATGSRGRAPAVPPPRQPG